MLLLVVLLMTCWAFVCVRLSLCVCVCYISLCISVLFSLWDCWVTCFWCRRCRHMCNNTQTHTHPQTITRKNSSSRNQARAQFPPSKAACLLVIARGIGSPLKQLRACVHVFKRQCYVSACHLWALALWFSATLTPVSFSFSLTGGKVLSKGLVAKTRPAPFVSPWESSLTVKKALVNY